MPTLHKRALAALALSVALTVAVAVSPAAAPPSAAAVSPESQVAALINQQRAKAGLPALKTYTVLNSTAETWSKHLASTKTFVHSTAAWRAARIDLYGFRSSGENLAAGYPTAAAAVSAWMKSAGHKANILGKSYKAMGIGFVSGGPHKQYWTVVFAGTDPAIPKGTAPALSGTSKVGGTVKASTSKWPSGTSFTWQWYRNGVAISGAKTNTYRVTSADAGAQLRAGITAYNKKYFPASAYSKLSHEVAR